MQDLISKIEQQEALLEVQQQAAASEARYRGLFENASDAIAMFDLQGQVVSVNKAAERAGGYSHDEALRLNFSQLMPPESRDVFEKNLERLLLGRPSPAEEVELIAKDGRRVPMEASSQLVYQRGEPVGIQVIARDITERRRAQKAQATLAAIVESSEDPIISTDFEGRAVLTRAVEVDHHVPVLVLTHAVDADCCIDALDAGAHEYVQKPLTATEVRELVGDYVKPPADISFAQHGGPVAAGLVQSNPGGANDDAWRKAS